MATYIFWLLAAFLVLVSEQALGIPSWDGGFWTRPQIAIGTLVPGSSPIEALEGGTSPQQYRAKFLSVAAKKGQPGPAVIVENSQPPLFFINQQKLWQPTNMTSIMHVNVLNVTGIDSAGRPHPAPLKLELSDEPGGVDGTFHWRGSKLHFDLGQRSNKGLYYKCQAKSGVRGVYTSLDDIPAPAGCNFVTLHSFIARSDRP
ncbi:hypothetical protein M0805_006975 [Coniferiporia weirii]|nr:hypothetical protein M0805_006975 [Coniferiporia weirii]